MKTILPFLLMLFFLQSCQNKDNHEGNVNTPINESWEVKQDNFNLTIEIIDSAQFYKQKNETKHPIKTIEKITDFTTAKKMLNGVVEFRENDESLRRILFRNGGGFNTKYPEESFVAYYPSEDIIVLEGGHTSDVSFDLRNGMETEETGNPDYIVTSPNNHYRLNGYFGGQECITYFIQKQINGQFQKVIDLDEVCQTADRHNLCVIEESFWKDDATFFFKDHIPDSATPIYWKVSILRAELPKIRGGEILKSKNPSDFIPRGFVLFKQDGNEQIICDFNKDGLNDVALIVKDTDKTYFDKNQFGVVVDKNRRGIIILINKGNHYELAVKNYDCFSSENEDGGVYYAPELYVEFKNSNLFISWHHGRYGYWKYTFMYQNRDFELIGYDASSNRGPIIESESSINFLTGMLINRENTNVDADQDTDVIFEETKKSIVVNELIRLSEILRFDELDISEAYSEK